MIQNHSLGVRIKYYRQKKGLTQKELGKAVGVVESAIRNYELGKRTPDVHILENIARELEVDFYSLYSPYHFSESASIHALFQLQELYGLEPSENDGEIVLKINPQKHNSMLSQHLESWYKALTSLKTGTISEEDYTNWVDAYPSFATIDDNDNPVLCTNTDIEVSEPNAKQIAREYEMYTLANSWAGNNDLMTLEEYKEFRMKNDE